MVLVTFIPAYSTIMAEGGLLTCSGTGEMLVGEPNGGYSKSRGAL
jgi:hypothetical protein